MATGKAMKKAPAMPGHHEPDRFCDLRCEGADFARTDALDGSCPHFHVGVDCKSCAGT